MGQIALLALAPRRFPGLVGIPTAVHYLRDPPVLRAAVLADDGCHRQQVGDVGGAGPLADLIPVYPGGVGEGLFELLSVGHRITFSLLGQEGRVYDPTLIRIALRRDAVVVVPLG